MFRQFLIVAAGVGILFAQQRLDRAWDLAAKGQRAQAIQLLHDLLKDDPQNGDAHLLLGSLLMEANQANESLKELQIAAQLKPGSSEAENALGEAYNKFGDVASARRAFEKAVALKPDDGIAQMNFGQALAATGDGEKAASHLDKAIQLLGASDDAADACYMRAKLFAALNEPENAAAQLEKAVSLRPAFAEAWSDLGQARSAMEDDAGALSALERAVAENPKDWVAQYRLGAQHLRQGNPHQAVQHLQTARQLSPDDQSVLNSLQMALRQDGRQQEANEVKRKLGELVLEKDKTNQSQLTAVKLNNEGAQLEKSGNLPAALAKYREASTLYPAHVGIQVNYALALLRLGHWKEGLEELHQTMLRDPKNTQVRKALKDALAQAPRDALPAWSGQIQ
jgi:tetratricopeptide (TPR) repeat protein